MLSYHFPAVVVCFDRGHPCFRNFNSTNPIGIIRVKSSVDSFLDPMSVPVNTCPRSKLDSDQSRP